MQHVCRCNIPTPQPCAKCLGAIPVSTMVTMARIEGMQSGERKGAEAERARVVAWLTETGRYDNPWNLVDVAYAIERGEHMSFGKT